MNIIKKKYIILAIIIGVLCKVYDDIYDNNLYGYLGISKDIIPYFNDILKGLFVIGYTIICINYPFFLITFTLCNIIVYFNCKQDFNSYEFSIFVSPIILIPFLKWNTNEYYKNTIWLIIVITGMMMVENLSNKEKNKEYSNQKLLLRFISLSMSILIVIYNSEQFISSDLLILFYFSIGYLFVSCITQIVLVNNLIKIHSKDNIKEIKKEEEKTNII